jgi:pimeloyl-ACP methyl ester carboxylesterase
MTNIPYIVNNITSPDGTTIGYRQLGHGPGLLLVHGGMMGSQNFMKLGRALADTFTIYIPDRRGRGLSGPAGDYGLAKESQDIGAMIQTTGATNLFGLSSGAIVVLQTALDEPTLRNVALYEPPIGHDPTAWMPQYDKEIAQAKFGAALLTVARNTGGPSPMTRLRMVFAPLLNLAIKADERSVKGDDVPLKTLIASMRYDQQAVLQSGELTEKAKQLQARTLLLGGSKSPAYLKDALDALEAAIPHASRVEIKGVGHLAADNSEQPLLVAAELRKFLTTGE